MNLEFGVSRDAADADLVVGADGVNSLIRAGPEHSARVAEGLQVRLVRHGPRLRRVHLHLQETEYGLFQVHAYPFDAKTSTFIVECTEDTWRRAGSTG